MFNMRVSEMHTRFLSDANSTLTVKATVICFILEIVTKRAFPPSFQSEMQGAVLCTDLQPLNWLNLIPLDDTPVSGAPLCC